MDCPPTECSPCNPGVREMAVLLNNGDIWHYDSNNESEKFQFNFMVQLMGALKRKRVELLTTDLPIIHSRLHNKTIFAHKADA